MFSRLAKLMLVLTALAPVALVYAWVVGRNSDYWLAAALVGGAIALLGLCLWLLAVAQGNLEKSNFVPVSVEAADRENIAFLLLYLSPLFTSTVGFLNLDIIIPTLIIFGIAGATGYNYHFNPLLGILGWHFYRVESSQGVTYVLITRKQLRRAGEIALVGQLTEYILIDMRG